MNEVTIHQNDSEAFDITHYVSQHVHSPAEDVVKVLFQYMLSGNMHRAALAANVNYKTANAWKLKPWFGVALAELRRQHQDELDGRITGIIHKCCEQIEDRLENGDEVLSYKGGVVRKKVSARDMGTILGINFDKRQILRNQPTAITDQSSETINRKLKQLADSFKQFALDNNPKIIESTYTVDS